MDSYRPDQNSPQPRFTQQSSDWMQPAVVVRHINHKRRNLLLGLSVALLIVFAISLFSSLHVSPQERLDRALAQSLDVTYLGSRYTTEAITAASGASEETPAIEAFTRTLSVEGSADFTNPAQPVRQATYQLTSAGSGNSEQLKGELLTKDGFYYQRFDDHPVLLNEPAYGVTKDTWLKIANFDSDTTRYTLDPMDVRYDTGLLGDFIIGKLDNQLRTEVLAKYDELKPYRIEESSRQDLDGQKTQYYRLTVNTDALRSIRQFIAERLQISDYDTVPRLAVDSYQAQIWIDTATDRIVKNKTLTTVDQQTISTERSFTYLDSISTVTIPENTTDFAPLEARLSNLNISEDI